MKLGDLREGFPGVHFESCNGDSESNINYCTKAESRVHGPYWFNRDGLVLWMLYQALRACLHGKPLDLMETQWMRLQSTHKLGEMVAEFSADPIGTQPFPDNWAEFNSDPVAVPNGTSARAKRNFDGMPPIRFTRPRVVDLTRSDFFIADEDQQEEEEDDIVYGTDLEEECLADDECMHFTPPEDMY